MREASSGSRSSSIIKERYRVTVVPTRDVDPAIPGRAHGAGGRVRARLHSAPRADAYPHTLPAHPRAAPTATPLPSQCVSDPNTGGAGISPDIPLPADAIIFDLGHGGSGSVTATPVSFVKTGVCTKSLTPDAVRALFAAQMPANGWAHSATFPANGDLNAPCPDAYCWKKTPAPNFARTVALENVRVVGGITVYAVDEIRYG